MIAPDQIDVNNSIQIFNKLPALHKKGSQLFYDCVKAGVLKANYSLDELASRLGRHKNNVSSMLNDLERWGFLESSTRVGGYKERWITPAGFSVLDNQPRNSTRSSNDTHSNIDLFESRIRDNTLSLEEQQPCGYLPTDEPSLRTSLYEFFRTQNLDLKSQTVIMSAFNSSPVSVYEKINVLDRVVAASKKKRIKSFRAYFLASLRSQELTIKQNAPNLHTHTDSVTSWVYG